MKVVKELKICCPQNMLLWHIGYFEVKVAVAR
jgi:hypothetical protein